MKKETFERYCLLEQSGELSRWKRGRLNRYLALSQDARQEKAKLQQIMEAATQRTSIAPPPFIKEQILREGRQHLHAGSKRTTLRPDWIFQPAFGVPLAVVATLLLVVLGVRYMQPPAIPVVASHTVTAESLLNWDDGFDDEINEMLATVYATETEVFSDGSDDSLWPDDDMSTEELAEELYIWESQS